MACTVRVAVPLKAMCSSTWAMPLVAGVSSREPTRRKTPTLTLWTWGMGTASSLTPLGSVRRTMEVMAALSVPNQAPDFKSASTTLRKVCSCACPSTNDST